MLACKYAQNELSVTQQPFKIPYYAALMRLLHEQPEGAEAPSLGRQILEDFWKGFQSYLDKLAWREARLCVSGQSLQRLLLLNSEQIQFFAHLTMARMISPDSMISLLQAFTSVLDEFGVSHGRAKRAAMCAAEGLMFVRGPGWHSILLTDALVIGWSNSESSFRSECY